MSADDTYGVFELKDGRWKVVHFQADVPSPERVEASKGFVGTRSECLDKAHEADLEWGAEYGVRLFPLHSK